MLNEEDEYKREGFRVEICKFMHGYNYEMSELQFVGDVHLVSFLFCRAFV